MTGGWPSWVRAASLLLAVAGCSLVSLSDRYGNSYGGWYNPGQQFQWQLATCDQQVAAATVPAPARKLAMRCCMWRHGVPIADPAACQAPAASLSARGEGIASARRATVDSRAGRFLS